MELVEQAIKKIEIGNVEEGLSELSSIAKTADHETKYEIAGLYYELGHMNKAKKIVEELLFFYPDEGYLYAFLAELLIDLNEEDQAIEYLLEIKEDDSAYLQAQLLLADLYQMQSLDEVAERRLLLAFKKAPDEPIISYGLGVFYLERGDYVKSIPYLKKAVHANNLPVDEPIELQLAEAYSASGQFEDAATYYKSGLQKRKEPHALFGYAFTAYQLKEFSISIKQLEKLKEMDPEFSSLYPLLAKAYEKAERFDEAMATLKEGFAVDEFNEKLYVQAGKVSFTMGRPAEGKQFLQEAVALNPANVEAVHLLATHLKDSGSFDELEELLAHMKEFGEVDHVYTWYEAVVLKEKDEFEKACTYFEEVAPYFQEDSEFLEDHGFFLIEYGLRDEGKKVLAKLLRLQPHRDDIRHIVEEDDDFF